MNADERNAASGAVGTSGGHVSRLQRYAIRSIARGRLALAVFRCPFEPNRTRNPKEDWSDEYSYEPECNQASNCAKHNEEKRYPRDAADKEGPQHIVRGVHEQKAPRQQQDAFQSMPRKDKPHAERNPNEGSAQKRSRREQASECTEESRGLKAKNLVSDARDYSLGQRCDE